VGWDGRKVSLSTVKEISTSRLRTKAAAAWYEFLQTRVQNWFSAAAALSASRSCQAIARF
jgi:hypothetical protein